jgi:peroxiredoxin
MKFKNKMFTMLGVLALSGLVAMAGDDKAAPAAKIGEKAPDFTLTDINGKQHSLKDYAGKIVVLDWVNPECPVCKGAHEDGRIPNMIKDIEKEGAVFLAINTTWNTDAEKNKAALEKYGVEYTLLLDTDGKVGKLFGAKTTPHVYVIDTEGVLRYQGALDNVGGAKVKDGMQVQNYGLNAVKQIKAGETVTPDSTKSYGCSVKYAKTAAAPKP